MEALRQALSLGPGALKLRDVVAFEIGGSPAVAVELRALAVLAASNRRFGEGAPAE